MPYTVLEKELATLHGNQFLSEGIKKEEKMLK